MWLVGVSPGGMNATGESDMNNYYDRVQSLQENVLRPAIDWMDSIILKSSEYDLDNFEYVFLPLKQLTEEEQATIDASNATRDQTYLDADVINKMDVMAQLAEKGTYVSIDDNRVEEEKNSLELDPKG